MLPTLLFALDPSPASAAATVPSFSWIDVLLSQGPAGLLAAVFAAAAWHFLKKCDQLQKDFDEERAEMRKENAALSQARIDDAKAASNEMLKLADRVHQTTDKLADVFDTRETLRKPPS